MQVFVQRTVSRETYQEKTGMFKTETKEVSIFRAVVRIEDFDPVHKEILDQYVRDKTAALRIEDVEPLHRVVLEKYVRGQPSALDIEVSIAYIALAMLEDGNLWTGKDRPARLVIECATPQLENYHLKISSMSPYQVEKVLQQVFESLDRIMSQIRFVQRYTDQTLERKEV